MAIVLDVAHYLGIYKKSPPAVLPPANVGIADRVSKVFSPYKHETGKQNPDQFYRDVHGTENVLAYENQTIYVKYKAKFDELRDLGEAQQQVIALQRADDSPENQALYDGLQDQIDATTAELNREIREDFQGFLRANLGPKRLHLIPEITYRFSQKAFTTLIQQVNDHTTKKYGGFFTDGQSEQQCTLLIPNDPNGAVRIDASTKGVFQSFLPANAREKVVRPVELIGHSVYTIGLNGKTKADIDFLLKDIA
jgi:hypothetical protein